MRILIVSVKEEVITYFYYPFLSLRHIDYLAVHRLLKDSWLPKAAQNNLISVPSLPSIIMYTPKDQWK